MTLAQLHLLLEDPDAEPTQTARAPQGRFSGAAALMMGKH